jgi:hypothetical protein
LFFFFIYISFLILFFLFHFSFLSFYSISFIFSYFTFYSLFFLFIYFLLSTLFFVSISIFVLFPFKYSPINIFLFEMRCKFVLAIIISYSGYKYLVRAIITTCSDPCSHNTFVFVRDDTQNCYDYNRILF